MTTASASPARLKAEPPPKVQGSTEMLPYGLPSATSEIATMLSQPAAPQAAFTWGAGGQRMTPEDIAAQRRRAAGMMQSDYSPIQSPWQGFARVANKMEIGSAAWRANVWRYGEIPM